MWADRETLVDLINVQHLVAAVTETIKEERLLPTTLGVFGDWGSGKSSLLGMAKRELEAIDGVVCITFDGSLFEGYEDAKAALMSTILEEIREKQPKGSELRKNANALLQRVNWFRMAGFLGKGALSFMVGEPMFGIAALHDLVGAVPQNLANLDKDAAEELVEKAGAAGKELKGLVKGGTPEELTTLRRSVREFRKDFAKLLEESTITTLVVFIDELDRCMPDTVLDTLQAIRLFLSVPGTAFVIGADERFVEHAVQVKFPLKPEEGRTLNIGRHYLEKIVHHPIRIPPLSEAEVTTYMNLLFTSLHVDESDFIELCDELLEEEADGLDVVRFDSERAIERFKDLESEKLDDLKEDLLLVSQIANVLSTGLDGNPRQTKRFLNMLRQRIRMAERRKVTLKRQVLAKLMLLEYFRLEHFRQLADWQAKQGGKPKELALLEKQQTDKNSQDLKGSDGEAPISETGADAESGEFASWENDIWLQAWLRNPPFIAGEDLRRYFFFAREKLHAQTIGMDNLSRPAQEVFELLLSQSEAEQARARERAKQLSPGDAASVTQSITAIVRRAEDLRGDTSPLWRLLSLGEARPDQLSEIVTLLGQLPHSQLSAGLPPRLEGITRGHHAATAARALLNNWSQSKENSRLRQAAKQILGQVN